MQLQYLETLKQVGSSPSTKLVVPMELGGLLNGLRNMLPVDPGRFSGAPSLGEASPKSGEPVPGTNAALGEAASRSAAVSTPPKAGAAPSGAIDGSFVNADPFGSARRGN